MNESDLLKKRRKQLGYSQQYMANQLGVTQQAYSKIEASPTNCSLSKIKQIANILELNVQDLISRYPESVEVFPLVQINRLENKVNEVSNKLDELLAFFNRA